MSLINILTTAGRILDPNQATKVSTRDSTKNLNDNQIRITPQTFSVMPPGGIMAFAGRYAPQGFLLCDGIQYNIDEYRNLFTLIGYDFGGAGDSFAVPDLRGRVIVHPDLSSQGGAAGRVTASNTFNKNGGAETHTLTVGQLPQHSHAISATLAANTTATGGQNRLTTLNNADNGNNDATSGTAGSGNPHNNMQPYLVLNYIIKY